MRQPGIEIRPIEQMTGGSEFSEVFFEEARTAKENVVGAVNGGWRVAMGTLAFERGASTLGQQLAFENELREITAVARSNGAVDDPLLPSSPLVGSTLRHVGPPSQASMA